MYRGGKLEVGKSREVVSWGGQSKLGVRLM